MRSRWPRLTRPRLAVPLLLLALVGAVVAWGAVAALQARTHLLDARATLVQLRDDGAAAGLDDVLAQVRSARDDTVSARSLLSQPGPALLARVPVLGRSLAAERDVARAGAGVLEAADRALAVTERLRGGGSSLDVVALSELAVELDRAAVATAAAGRTLEALELGWTPQAVREPVEEARDLLVGVDDDLATASGVVDALAGLLGARGPRSVVFAVMNNAELRGAGGYVSTIAVAAARDGAVTVGPLLDTNDLDDPAETARAVPASPDYNRRYSTFFAATTLWKNVHMSPHGPDSAQVTCAVVQLAPGVPCDAVVLLDVPALAALVELSGPVQLPGGEQVAGAELVEALLVEAYDDVADDGQEARRAGLRAAAGTALSDLLSADVDPVELGRLLARSAAGRHVVLWSAVPDEQAALDRAGLTGSVDPEGDDLNLVVFNQLSASKLDFYVERRVGVEVVLDRGRATVTQDVTLSLDHPEGLSTYVTGFGGRPLRGLLEIAVSSSAVVREVTLNGTPVDHEVVEDTGSRRVVLEAVLANRESGTWSVTYEVPTQDEQYRMRLLPQALAVDATLTVSVDAAPGLRLKDGPSRVESPYAETDVLDVALR